MALSINGNLTGMKVSTVSVADIAANGKFIECEVSSSDSMTANVAEKPTKRCGTIKTVGTPSTTISGNAVQAGDLSATQVSAQQIRLWIDGGTLIYFIYQNDVYTTLTAGEVTYMAGSGYFNSVSGNNAVDEISDFDWEFQPSGVIDLVP